jgi:hypothetical protein
MLQDVLVIVIITTKTKTTTTTTTTTTIMSQKDLFTEAQILTKLNLSDIPSKFSIINIFVFVDI